MPFAPPTWRRVRLPADLIEILDSQPLIALYECDCRLTLRRWARRNELTGCATHTAEGQQRSSRRTGATHSHSINQKCPFGWQWGDAPRKNWSSVSHVMSVTAPPEPLACERVCLCKKTLGPRDHTPAGWPAAPNHLERYWWPSLCSQWAGLITRLTLPLELNDQSAHIWLPTPTVTLASWLPVGDSWLLFSLTSDNNTMAHTRTARLGSSSLMMWTGGLLFLSCHIDYCEQRVSIDDKDKWRSWHSMEHKRFPLRATTSGPDSRVESRRRPPELSSVCINHTRSRTEHWADVDYYAGPQSEYLGWR